MKQNVQCPVCGQHTFEWENDFDICPVCGWENDGVQGADPDYWDGANDLSVNDSKLIFYLSQDLKKKSALLELKKRHEDILAKIYLKYKKINYCIDGDKARNEFHIEHLRYMSEINELANES
jgi:hypothetical protein